MSSLIILLDDVKINISTLRKFYYILTQKDKINLGLEYNYYMGIYSAVDKASIITALINKYINMKLYKRIYIKTNDKY